MLTTEKVLKTKTVQDNKMAVDEAWVMCGMCCCMMCLCEGLV